MPNATPSDTNLSTRQTWRLFKDKAARHGVALGGISVIIAIVLIFFYLLYEVYPLFLPAEIGRPQAHAARADGRVLYLAMEEQNEQGVRYTRRGVAEFFRSRGGELIERVSLLPGGTELSSLSAAEVESGVVGLGLSDGRVLVVKHRFKVSYVDGARRITPVIEYPLGRDPLVVDDQRRPIRRLALNVGDEQSSIVALTDDGRMQLLSVTFEESMLDDEPSREISMHTLPEAGLVSDYLLMDQEQRKVYAASRQGELVQYDISDPDNGRLKQRLRVVEAGHQITAMQFLTGTISLLIGDSRGRVGQWFPVRDENNNETLTLVRHLQLRQAPVTAIAPESRRKGFAAADSEGWVGLFHSTAERRLLTARLSDAGIGRLAFSPRANGLLYVDERGGSGFVAVHNEHPEVSWSSLWGKVWYESYTEPAYIWQSSSASNDFEPKFSLTPIAFGTLKAAFYAMLFAVPLAILGAVYTAYFMAPGMRRLVKPGIEIMEALPTVIIGFLAGLWLAPVVEENLAGMFGLLLVMPVGVLLFGYAWSRLPMRLRQRVPEGWQAALLIPVVLGLGWLAFLVGTPLELYFFGGNLPHWLSENLGIPYDQRNSLVVGLAMGFAIIPTIFSIAEDAIFSVPKHLTFGSLALGATPWQTLVRVVILTASPGIFSAVMIGMGRAVGETMIVLMATGNTPVMDFSIFQGMRTLSANIAVEMPESEVHSTHFRVLFLAALVLFLFTFLFNTAAELVRQRLRRKYSSL